MNYSTEFLENVENFAKNELLEFMVLSCGNKEIPLFISKAILSAIQEASTNWFARETSISSFEKSGSKNSWLFFFFGI